MSLHYHSSLPVSSMHARRRLNRTLLVHLQERPMADAIEQELQKDGVEE